MFAFLALAGDLGCASGPTLVGFAADASNGDLRVGMLLAVIFPVILLTGLLTLRESSVVEEG
jgi:MFS-type transporter involved in bile tolerance (Atg22 family)